MKLNPDVVLRFPYAAGDTRLTASGTKLVDLPAGPINQHWTKNLIANRDGWTRRDASCPFTCSSARQVNP